MNMHREFHFAQEERRRARQERWIAYPMLLLTGIALGWCGACLAFAWVIGRAVP